MRVTACEEGKRIDGHPGGGQFGEGVQQAGQAVLAGGVAADGGVRAVAQDLADEVGEDASRPRLDENPGARLVHGLDLLGEPDGPGTLPGEGGGEFGRVRVVRGGGRAGPHGEGG